MPSHILVLWCIIRYQEFYHSIENSYWPFHLDMLKKFTTALKFSRFSSFSFLSTNYYFQNLAFKNTVSQKWIIIDHYVHFSLMFGKHLVLVDSNTHPIRASHHLRLFIPFYLCPLIASYILSLLSLCKSLSNCPSPPSIWVSVVLRCAATVIRSLKTIKCTSSKGRGRFRRKTRENRKRGNKMSKNEWTRKFWNLSYLYS